ncbi:error-prone DNA polymerase [Pedobacter nutrimenti]|uniref:error-prone DNA polymerase n=1 Tax=Pedobacter nutrimenti TaxID=1241337 RepID=UPI0029312764|nr:error-prone DNA polymerase [Pedobacter nutrimenti]
MSYTELQVTTNFTFLRGGSHPEEVVQQAAALGYTAIAVTDHNTMAGIVRAHVEAKAKGIRLIPACRLNLLDGPSLLAYPTDRDAYARLSGLLTEGNLRTEKGACHLYKADVYQYAEGIKFIVTPPYNLNARFDFDEDFKASLIEYKKALGSALYIAAIRSYQADDIKRLFRISQLSEQTGIPMVATNDIHYHDRDRRELQDIVTCTREKCTIYNAGFKLFQNAERYMKPIPEMIRLFRQYPDAIARTQEIVSACTFSLDSLKYIEPEEKIIDGLTPQQRLVQFTWEGAHKRYGAVIPDKVKKQLAFELAFLERRKLAPYFLRVYKYTQEAQARRILYQGRGSAANSTVCYCLAITAVDPMKSRLLFSRFMSDAREEWPDIDVDFEHERREEIIQYIYEDYGREHAAIVATVTQLHWKGAVRDVGKAMGLSVDAVDRLSKSGYELTQEWLEGKSGSSEGFDPNDGHLIKVLELTQQYKGFPRQLGQHTGGFVITDNLLSDICPILNARMENRTQLEWNKDDLEALGILKVDILALGMLTMIRKAFDLAKDHYGLDLTLANIPQDDPKVYEMISHADTIGVFQIESRAQMSMLPRLRPKCFYDLVIEVAIVRPGPIQGDMVHPYLRRRNGEEPVVFPSKELEEILGRTLGVPLFQEQAMEIAIVAAGFTPAEADQLRRSMASFKANGKLHLYEKKLVDGMVARGYEEDFSRRVFKQLQGFEGYGFPESHSASFALLVYISSWLKYYYPEIFATALLNSMPMGFYQPAQIVIDAKKHGVEVLPVDINYSHWDNILEARTGKYYKVRLGFRQVKGLREDDMQVLVSARHKAYTSIHVLLDVGVSIATLERLADADAFRSIGLDRRQALWEVSALNDRPVGLFDGQPSESDHEKPVSLPVMTASEHVLQDYSTTSLSLKAHPVSFVRKQLFAGGILTTKELDLWPDGTPVRVAGLILVRQRPGTATGVCFITIEDETSIANLVVFPKLFDKYRKEIIQSKLLMVEGKLQREGEVTHVIVRHVYNMSGLLRQLNVPGGGDPDVLTPSRADEHPAEDYKTKDKRVQVTKAIQGEIFPAARNFK